MDKLDKSSWAHKVMRAVNIADLKNNLSNYLKKVQAGEEIVVRDRDQPIARLVPFNAGNEDELTALAAQGKLRLGSQLEEAFWDLPAPRVSARTLSGIIAAEREDA